MTTRSADVVVVGAGMAGLEAALALRSAGAGALVVVDGSVGGVPPPRLSSGGRLPDLRMHRRAGGRSLAWHGVTIRLEPWALDAWPTSVARALRTEWYDAVEGDLEDWADAPLGLAREHDRELGDRLTGLTGASWQVVPRAVRADADGWRAYTPLDRWSSGPSREETVPGSVTEVVKAHGRVAGVRLAAGGETIRAGRVLLAAGALETTRLVAQLRGRTEQEYPLVDHLVQGFLVHLPGGALPSPGFAMWPADEDTRCTVFARTRDSAEGTTLDVWMMGEQLPDGASRLRYPDAGEPPWEAVLDPRLGPADAAVLDAGRSRMDALWSALDRGEGPAWPAFLDKSHSFAEALAVGAEHGRPLPYTWPLGTVHHEGSSLPYGSGVDEDGRVPEVPGLWVAGPAAFGRPGAANPSLTTLALARRTARLLARD